MMKVIILYDQAVVSDSPAKFTIGIMVIVLLFSAFILMTKINHELTKHKLIMNKPSLATDVAVDLRVLEDTLVNTVVPVLLNVNAHVELNDAAIDVFVSRMDKKLSEDHFDQLAE